MAAAVRVQEALDRGQPDHVVRWEPLGRKTLSARGLTHILCLYGALQNQERIIGGRHRIDWRRGASKGVTRSVPGMSEGKLLVSDRRIQEGCLDDVDADERRTAIRLEAKPGAKLNISEIENCLDYTLGGVEPVR
jgi:hypothetical protein